MFEKYMIVEEEAANESEAGNVTGFRIGARIPYYRGLGISMIEDIQLKVDGETVAPEQMLVEIHGNQYTLKEMEKEPEDRWEFGEVGRIHVKKPGGLSPGQHTIDMTIHLRISYMPVIGVRKSSKKINM